MKRWLAIAIVTGVVAAICFPLAKWFAQTVRIECVRPSPEQFHCVVQLTAHSATRTHAFDQGTFRGAEVAEQVSIDREGMVEQTFRLRLKVEDGRAKGHIDSAPGGRYEHQARAERINRFAATPGERSLDIRFDNGSDLLWMAAINTVIAAVLTWVVTRKS